MYLLKGPVWKPDQIEYLTWYFFGPLFLSNFVTNWNCNFMASEYYGIPKAYGFPTS
jgi:hypothetical protein